LPKRILVLPNIISKILNTIFPEFTNKITWAVIAAGIALLSSSFVEQILRALINDNLNWNLTDGNDAFWGVIVIALGLLHNYGFVREKNKPQHDVASHEKLNRELEHDQTLFKKLEEYIEESYLKNYINFILTNHSYFSKDDEPLDYFYYKAAQSQYNFINSEINDVKIDLHKSYVEFENFMSHHFFAHGPARSDNSLYLCMHPDWNMDRGGHPTREEDIAYDELAKKLIELGEKVEKKYENYRLLVKRELAI
jgi:hypothetical protein